MSKNIWTVGAFFIVFGMSAHADLLNLNFGTASSETKIDNIPIAQSGTVSLGNSSIPMAPVGAALRNKKVAFLNPSIYVAQVLVSDPSKYVHACNKGQPNSGNASLASLDNEQVVAIRLDYVYNGVSVNDIDDAMNDSFNANNVNVGDPAIAKLLGYINASGTVNSGDTWVLVLQRQNTTVAGKPSVQETLTYQAPSGQIYTIPGSGKIDLMTSVMSLWMGKTPSDDPSLATFRTDLLCGTN